MSNFGRGFTKNTQYRTKSQQMMRVSAIFLSILVIFFVSGCTELQEQIQNKPPMINGQIIVAETTLYTGETVDLAVTATDEDEDELTYTWITGSGLITGSGKQVKYTAPMTSGKYSVTVLVSDGITQVTSAIELTVENLIQINEITVDPASPMISEAASVTVDLTKLKDVELTYDWSATDGTISGEGQSVSYLAPDTGGVDSIGVVVSGPGRNQESMSIEIEIRTVPNNPPVINQVITETTIVNPGEAVTVSVDATDTDGDELRYLWTDVAGNELGTTENLDYTPPLVAGAYPLTIEVTDGIDTVSESISLTVTNIAPTVTIIGGTETLHPGDSVTLSLEVDDPNGDNLTYVWRDGSDNVISEQDSVIYQPATHSGIYPVNVQVTDGELTVTDEITVTVENRSPVLEIGNKWVDEGENLEFEIIATDLDNYANLTYTVSGELAEKYNAETKVFSWTPNATDKGTYSMQISVTDGEATDSEVITITVNQAIYTVPGEYATIQEAINYAQDECVVEVSPGEYHEDLLIAFKSITLRSTNPNDSRIVDSTKIIGSGGAPTIIFMDCADMGLEGMTVTGGDGVGVYIDNCQSGKIENNIIAQNRDVGLWIDGGERFEIVSNTIRDHQSYSQFNAGIYAIQTDELIISKNTLENNSSQDVTHTYGGGIYVLECDNLIIDSNQIERNISYYGGGIALDCVESGIIARNNIVENASNVGSGIYLKTSQVDIYDNILMQNRCQNQLFGNSTVILEHDTCAAVYNNRFSGNQNDATIGSIIYVTASSQLRDQSGEYWVKENITDAHNELNNNYDRNTSGYVVYFLEDIPQKQ